MVVFIQTCLRLLFISMTINCRLQVYQDSMKFVNPYFQIENKIFFSSTFFILTYWSSELYMKCTHIRDVLSKHCIFNLYIQHVNFRVNTSESEFVSVYVSTTLEYLKRK